jgi:V8-like Glu-specific endopeptidase
MIGKDLPNKAWFTDEEGENFEGVEVVIPICKWLDEEMTQYKPIGTSFLISRDGLIVTAKHILEEMKRLNDDKTNFFCILFMPEKKKYKRVPLKPFFHTAQISDIGFTQMSLLKKEKTGEFYISKRYLPLSSKKPQIGEFVTTYSMPRESYSIKVENTINLNPTWCFGRIVAYHKNGFGILKGSCYETDMVTKHGSSGGPVFNEKGFAIGVNSSGHSNTNISYFTPIEPLLEINFKMMWQDELIVTNLKEMHQKGWIKIVEN